MRFIMGGVCRNDIRRFFYLLNMLIYQYVRDIMFV